MANLRGERFEHNRNELKKINSTFRIIMIFGVGCSLAIFVIVYLIYLFKGMLLATGSSMFIAETALFKYGGEGLLATEKPHADEFPFFWMFYLLAMAIATLIGTTCRIKKVNYFIFAAYFWTSIYGVFSLITSKEVLIMSLTLFIGGLLGLWLTHLSSNLYVALEELSLQDGFPDFIDIIDEPHPIPNTNGIYYRQYIHMKNKIEEKKEIMRKQLGNPNFVTEMSPEDVFIKPADLATPSDEMDDLSIDFDEPIEELFKKPERLQ